MNIKKIFGVMLIVVLCGVSQVNAKETIFTNSKGVKITESEYTRLKTLFSDRRINVITEEELLKFKGGKIVKSDTKYIKEKYVNGKLNSSIEITEEEYNNSSNVENSCDIMPLNDDSDYFETTYKKFSADLLDYGRRFTLFSNVEWKKVPAVKSYDVFAFRVKYFSYDAYSGQQLYYTDTGSDAIDYNSSSPGYKGLSEGAGFSMNLKDGDNITGYDLTVSVDLTVNTTVYKAAEVYVSYQHAQNDVTRAQSMDYTIDISGLGNVVLFNKSSIEARYDGMAGLRLYTPINQ